jgi:hypothetical protein
MFWLSFFVYQQEYFMASPVVSLPYTFSNSIEHRKITLQTFSLTTIIDIHACHPDEGGIFEPL